MKKLIALLLAALMVLGMAACGATEEDKGGNTTDAPATDAPTTTAAQMDAPASALEVLENTWALYGEEEKFFAMGGMTDDGAPAADNAPGSVVLSPSDYLQYNLLVPAENVGLVTECASIMHAMNANTFTCGAYKVSDADAFVAAMEAAIDGNQWMCGFPEKLLIANVGGVIVIAFGNGEVMDTFTGHLETAYAGVEKLVDKAIG